MAKAVSLHVYGIRFDYKLFGKMNYVNMVKTMVQSGQNYIRNYGKTPHAGRIDKAEVIAAAKSFNDNQLDPRKCQKVLTELICLLNRG